MERIVYGEVIDKWNNDSFEIYCEELEKEEYYKGRLIFEEVPHLVRKFRIKTGMKVKMAYYENSGATILEAIEKPNVLKVKICKIELDGFWFDTIEDLKQKYNLIFKDVTKRYVDFCEFEGRKYCGPQVMVVIGEKEEIVKYLLEDYGIEENELEEFEKSMEVV